MLPSRFGHFSPDGRAYRITDPATPMPWVNVICNGHYGVVVSQNGGGFSWLDNSQLNVLTRWEMDMVRDDHGRFIYLRDLESDEIWSLSPAPTQPVYDHYLCEHAPGRTTFRTSKSGIEAEWTIGVHPDDAIELWRIRLTNTGASPRRLRIASFFEWCCGVAPDVKREFHRLFFTVEHDAARRAVIARKNMWDTPTKSEKEHWNKPWPYVAGHRLVGPAMASDLAIGDKRLFVGRNGSRQRPDAMAAPRPPAPDTLNNFGRYGDASAALGGEVTIAPGQTLTLGYTLGIAGSDADLLAMLDRHATIDAIDRGLAASEGLWERILAASQVRTAQPDFDLLNSTWLPYQAISGRLWARTGYYQQSGAFGFRDQLQDSQVWLPRDPARTREQILLHAAHQFRDGSVYHWWHPLAEFGLRTLCSDDYLWLPLLTATYIRDAGDWSILSAKVPFVDDPAGATLLEHCRRSIARSLERQSPRGLPLIGACDWNDGLSAMGVDGKGESVWLAQWLCPLLEDLAVVVSDPRCPEPDAALAKSYRAARDRLAKAVNDHAWDGRWYKAATRDDGRWIGQSVDHEGRIFLNTQTWAILSQTAPADRQASAWASVREHLLAPMGPLLSHPAYTTPDASIGYITRYAPGLRENGGVYMHAATWALAAACKVRDLDAVEQIYRSIAPPLRGQDAGAYWAEPYVMPGNVDGPISTTPGKAGWTWYTGSAAWLNKVCLEWVIGLRPTWEGLLIDPCPPRSLGRIEATRRYRGRTVRIRMDAAGFGPGRAAHVSVAGRRVEGGIIRAEDYPVGSTIDVDVAWGDEELQVHVNGQTAQAGRAPAGARRHPQAE
jgi:cellobiose phosphorylase